MRVSAQPHRVGDALRTRFADNSSEALIAVAKPDTASLTSTTNVAARANWDRYSRTLSRLPGVLDVQGPTGTYKAGSDVAPAGAQPRERDGYAYWTVDNTLDPTGSKAANLVRQIRAVDAPTGSTVLVGGRAADLVDQKSSIGGSLPWALAIVIIASFIMLFLFTGSIVIPIKALALNALTLFTVVGAMVWIFQGGHFDNLLKFTPTSTTTTIPPLLFVIAFGLSMDYEVFVISRIKEMHDSGLSNRDAIIAGMAKAGSIIITAAALLSVTFFAFGLSKISFLQFFGIGTGVAILLDAIVIRCVLVPAVMQMLGERTWWAPAPLRKVYDRFGLREESAVDRGLGGPVGGDEGLDREVAHLPG